MSAVSVISKSMGCNNTCITWFESYLTQRRQLVDISGTKSDFCTITCGVPQGSILGPLLFLCYCNDMEMALKCTLLLYADDSALIVSGKHVTEIESTLSYEMNNLSNWLIDNRLSLHLGKTETILFGSKRKIQKAKPLSVKCKNVDIKQTKNVKYLGANIDHETSGESMVQNIITKCGNKLKYLYRQCKHFDIKTKRQIANALVLCHLDYASSSWYHGLTKSSQSKLQITLNKIVRFVLGKGNRYHIGYKDYATLGWLPVSYRVCQLQLNHMYKVKNGSAPCYLRNEFISTSDIHNKGTRQSFNSFFVPQVGSSGKSSFRYTGIKAWNALPHSIRNVENYMRFKIAVKKHMLFNVKQNEKREFILF